MTEFNAAFDASKPTQRCDLILAAVEERV